MAPLCFLAAAAVALPADLYREPYRPQLHFTPPQGWMNDPNGLVYYAGEYHLFYQHYPFDSVWGPMHWGHAVSRDLIHWQQLPIALFPDNHGVIFSGSAVVDVNNSSGFGSRENPPLVAIFTYHDLWAEKLGLPLQQSQGLAYSLDKGRSWVKYAHNPVLKSPGLRDFRDPKVFWHAASKRWVMALAVKDRVSFYASADLKTWRHLSDFGQGGAAPALGSYAGVWECPDLIRMRVEGSGEEKYLLLVSITPGGPNGGSATQYFVGDFDGTRFVPDPHFAAEIGDKPAADALDKAIWLDHGADNYAGVSWTGLPESEPRTLFIGWMSNWNYAQLTPSKRWRSALTLPRELVLVKRGASYRVHSRPVAELAQLHAAAAHLPAPVTARQMDLNQLLGVKQLGQRLRLTLDLQQAQQFSLTLGNGTEQLVLSLDRRQQQLLLDRSRSGRVDFEAGFARPQRAPLQFTGLLELELVIDHSSVEIFVNGGERVLTSQLFPAAPYDRASLSASAPVSLAAASSITLGSIWP